MARGNNYIEDGELFQRDNKYSADNSDAWKQALSTKAALRLWEKLEFWTTDINLEAFDADKPRYSGTWAELAAVNDLMDILEDEVNEEFKYVLTDFDKDWVVCMFLYFSMSKYNEEFDLKLEPRE